MSQNETVYFQDKAIVISNLRAVIDGTTYPTGHITAVYLESANRHVPAGLFILFVACVFAFLFFSGMFGWTYLLIGGALFGLSIVLFTLRDYRVEAGHTSGKRTVVVSTKNRLYAQKVRDALSNAVISK